jgi:hypothetical protein
MMSTTPDKKTESINALKNANKHLADVFADLAKKDQTLQTCASDLQRVAAQCGDIHVSVWIGQKQEMTPLKSYLTAIATSLNGAR